jgi:hypothetical protein
VRAARSYLVEDLNVPPERLVYFGESLGNAVVTEPRGRKRATNRT